MKKPERVFQRYDKTLVELPLSALRPYGGNAVYRTSGESLTPLEESIRKDGLMNPPSVVALGKFYSIGDGGRRFACLKKIYEQKPDVLVPCWLFAGLTCAQLFGKYNGPAKGARGVDWLSVVVEEKCLVEDMPKKQAAFIEALVEIYGSIEELQFLRDLGRSPGIVEYIHTAVLRMKDGVWAPPVADVGRWVAIHGLQYAVDTVNRQWHLYGDQDKARAFLRTRFEGEKGFKPADVILAAGLK